MGLREWLRAGEPLQNAFLAGSLGAVLAWAGAPGTDFPAHAFQLWLFVHHGFELWNDAWYAGRYTFVGYSLIYYPLAALVGIRTLAVASVALAAWAFSALVDDRFGVRSRSSGRLFALAAASSLLTGAFPYGLGFACALTSLVGLARGRVAVFALLSALAYAASPLAFAFECVALLATLCSARRRPFRRALAPALVIAAIGVAALILVRLFPDPGRYPYQLSELIAALCFCGAGAALSWRAAEARTLRFFYLIYGALCLLSFAVPSDLGGNVVRLRFVALPLAVLTVALRRWRPLPLALGVVALALLWNVSPLAYSAARSGSDPSAHASYWQPAITFLQQRLSPGARVEVVATADHWEALYLPEAGIPLARGWFRQDDFPLNTVLYAPLTAARYLSWLRQLAVGYVVLTDAALDYSAEGEAALLRSGVARLPVVLRNPELVIYAVPAPGALISGPGHPRVLSAGPENIVVRLSRPGGYRISLHDSPYLIPSSGCTRRLPDGLTELEAPRAGRVTIAFSVSLARLLDVFAGRTRICAPRPETS